MQRLKPPSSAGRFLGIAALLAAAIGGILARAADTAADTATETASNAAAHAPSNGGMAAVIQPFLDDHVLAGAVVLVTDKDKILDLEAIGYSDLPHRKPIEPTDLFYIASMTKCFTATALMMMVDEGRVNLDDPVEKYLPEFKAVRVEEADGKGHSYAPQHPITIKEVMSHTAGIVGETRPRHFNLEQEAKARAKMPLSWEPGTRYKYGPGPNIGGRIVELVSGIPYCQFIQERLLDPLGMKDTTFWPTAEQAAHLALTHEYNPATKTLEVFQLNADLIGDPAKCGAVPPIVLSQFPAAMIGSYENHYARPAGSLFSTAPDIARFCQMLLGGGTYKGKKYISPVALKQMTSIYTDNLPGTGGPDRYGIGFIVKKKSKPGEPSVGSFGHHGSRQTQMWIDPDNGIAMILMIQSAELAHEQQDGLYGAYQKQAIARFGKNRP